MGLFIGISIMALGLIIFVVGFVKNKKISVSADNSSMAVGGDNSGNMVNINQSNMPAMHKTHNHSLTWIAISVEIIGIAVTIWHASHMASK